MPSSYQDRTLSKEITPNQNLITPVTVISYRLYGSRLQIELFLERFNIYASGIFFKTTPYHKKAFKVGSKHIISGKVNIYNNRVQIVQPKSIKEYGYITPIYKKSIKESQMRYLISKYVTEKTYQRPH